MNYQSKIRFDTTFSTNKSFKKYRWLPLMDPETNQPTGMIWKCPKKLYDKILALVEEE